ncbi:MAG: D-alanine--D-alanine ligase [Actinomyces sp.]|nr:D-alanine--D-alanine ligase [Actinomyces sp.]MCI1642717.1 D-alanine--D-alanine ligase [Actinomyces sp.]MCI1691882.1 D-alanine--D-alanine ligase [Actinomyces sp.]
MTTTPRILIIAGGLTHERDVSVRSGRRVANVLHQAGHEVRVCDLDASLLPALEEWSPDVVWPLVHGSIGEDGSLQALLESLGVPFVGSHSVQAMMASNKPTAKGLLASAGVSTPAWLSLPQSLFRQLGATAVLQALDPRLTFPVVVKPTDGGSALGISRADGTEALRSAMVDAFAYGERVMIEQFVGGTEVAVSILDLEDGPAPLPPIEIVTDDGSYNYDARYTTDTTQYFVPARLDAALTSAVAQAAVQVHQVLGLRHLSRIDFIVDSEGSVWFIDANVAPGMTDTSLFPQAAEAAGSFADTCRRIVAFAASGR